MSDVGLPDAPLAPYVTGDELVARLGGYVEPAVADQCVNAATMAVWTVIDDPGWNDIAENPAPDAVQNVTLMVASELYRAGSAPSGDYQLDAYVAVPAGVGSNLVRRYYALLAPWRSLGGMIG